MLQIDSILFCTWFTYVLHKSLVQKVVVFLLFLQSLDYSYFQIAMGRGCNYGGVLGLIFIKNSFGF